MASVFFACAVCDLPVCVCVRACVCVCISRGSRCVTHTHKRGLSRFCALLGRPQPVLGVSQPVSAGFGRISAGLAADSLSQPLSAAETGWRQRQAQCDVRASIWRVAAGSRHTVVRVVRAWAVRACVRTREDALMSTLTVPAARSVHIVWEVACVRVCVRACVGRCVRGGARAWLRSQARPPWAALTRGLRALARAHRRNGHGKHSRSFRMSGASMEVSQRMKFVVALFMDHEPRNFDSIIGNSAPW